MHSVYPSHYYPECSNIRLLTYITLHYYGIYDLHCINTKWSQIYVLLIMYESHCAGDYVQCIIRVQFKVGQFMGCHMRAGVRLTGPTGHLA